LGGRPRRVAAAERDDRLHVELERVFLERALELLQPLDLAALACEHLVARRIDVNAATPLLLGNVASRVRGTEHAFRRAAVLADLDETDAHADIEDTVLPRELLCRDRLAD